MAGTPHSVKSKEKRTRVPWLALSNLEEWALIREPGQSRRLGCYQPGQQQKIDRQTWSRGSRLGDPQRWC